MTSLKQIEANRRNAQKSTGPTTVDGKQRSRSNALRHGLTAETVIGVLESAEDYVAFEAAIMAEYDPQSVIARELVARLASLLWRLRRATAIETGLFAMQADPLASFRQSLNWTVHPDSRAGLHKERDVADLASGNGLAENERLTNDRLHISADHFVTLRGPNLVQCFLRLASSPNFAFDRLSRYEGSLWRQAEQIMLALSNWRVPRDSSGRS
jgi:hypothetical protein